MSRNYPFGLEAAASESAVSFSEIHLLNNTNLIKCNTELLRRKYGEEIGVLLMMWIEVVRFMSIFKAIRLKTNIRIQ